jgi:ubiquitin
MPIYKTSQFTGTSLYDDAQDLYGLSNRSSIKSKTTKSQRSRLSDEEAEESDKNKNSKVLMANLGIMVGYEKGGMPPRNKKNYRSTEAGAGMTQAGVKAYRRMNPGSKLSTAVTEDNPGPKNAARRKSYCARSAGQMKMFPNAAKDPNSRIRQARRRWKC